MAMIYNSIPYFPTQVSFFEEVAMELIEARYGMKAETAVMKLVCKIYKENGYYMVWNEEQCTLFTNKVGREIAKEEMQGIVETLMEKGFFDKETYKEHGILTSVEIQRVWLEANKTEQNKANENRELPPLTPPPGEDVGVWRKYSFIEFPGYAYNKNTHNLECLLLALDGLHINDPNDTKAILKLSDYGRLGNEVWKIIHATKWSIVNSKGKYLIGALNKARTQG